MFNKPALTECPVCQGLDPDPYHRGFCALCGAVYRQQLRFALRIAWSCALIGIALIAAAAAARLWFELSRGVSVSLLVVGSATIVCAAFSTRRLSTAMLSALALRTGSDTLRLLASANRLHFLLLAFFLLTLAGAVRYYLHVEAPRRQFAAYQERFADKIEEYGKLVAVDAAAAEVANPHVVGKIVAIEKGPRGAHLSDLQAALPSELRAEGPAEVGTVVWIEWHDFRAGTYGTSGIVAYRVDAKVTIIDAATKTVLAREGFHGGEPPGVAPRDGSPGRGPKPLDQIVTYLLELPRQAG